MNLFDLSARITLDSSQYEKGLKNAEGKFNGFCQKLGGLLKGAGKVASGLLKIGAAGIGAGATAVGGLVKSASDAYATYEQLVGGAELLFGDAYDYIADKAKTAYKDVQMSQNDYLRQVNGFAVGLKTAMNGNAQAAAELAAKIVTAEADVVAATGNSQEAVQNAFNGIMKGNYTMLDNLQLGITPTKNGFQEVIDKVNEWNKAQGKSTKYTIDNLADAQSALVDYIEMQGLAGYAANEASETIEGSAASMKSAWEDVKVSIASGNGVGEAIGKFVSSAKDYIGNLKPVIKNAVQGVGTIVRELGPVIVQEIPPIVKEILPALLDASADLIDAAMQIVPDAINQILNVVFDNLDKFIDTALLIVESIASAIFDHADQLIEAAFRIVGIIVDNILDAINSTDWEQVGKDIVDFIMNIDWSGLITDASSLVGGIVGAIFGLLVGIFETVITDIGNWLYDNFGDPAELTWEGFIKSLGEVFSNIGTWVMQNIVEPLIKGFCDALGFDGEEAVNAMYDWFDDLGESITGFIDDAKETFGNIVDAVKKPFTDAWDFMVGIVDKIKSLFDFKWELPKLKLPHFSIGTGPTVLGIQLPKINIDWYRKAYEQPYLFDRPTVIGNKGFGDGNGAEMVYGRDNLMRDIREAVGESGITVNVYADKGMNVDELVEKFERSLARAQRQRKAALA